MPTIVCISVWRPSTKLEDYKRLHEAKEIPSKKTGSPFREPLVKKFNAIVRLEREAYLGVDYDHRIDDIGGYWKGYKSDGVTRASGSLNLLFLQISSYADTPLCPTTLTRGQRSSETLLNVATEWYIKDISACEVCKIFNLSGIESMSSTQLSNTS